ncbi:unnamed protein product [Ectocarpus sp. CCAP 1310/34]|nr:unnamed protein product [Ectocarpus sp. CCAP 1310/34]
MWQDGGTQVRTQLPLRLCWAITMHKSQGQTLAKAVIDLGPKEACTGLTFVCLSRAKRLVDLIVEPMSFDRIGNLGNSSTMKGRLQEEVRLGELARTTRVRYTDMGVFGAVAGKSRRGRGSEQEEGEEEVAIPAKALLTFRGIVNMVALARDSADPFISEDVDYSVADLYDAMEEKTNRNWGILPAGVLPLVVRRRGVQPDRTGVVPPE